MQREVTSHFFLTCRCLWLETSTTALWLVTAWVFSLWMLRAAISSSDRLSQTTQHKASLGHEGVEETVEGGGGEEGRSRKEVGRRSCGGDPQGARAGQRVGEGTEPGEVSRGRFKKKAILVSLFLFLLFSFLPLSLSLSLSLLPLLSLSLYVSLSLSPFRALCEYFWVQFLRLHFPVETCSATHRPTWCSKRDFLVLQNHGFWT